MIAATMRRALETTDLDAIEAYCEPDATALRYWENVAPFEREQAQGTNSQNQRSLRCRLQYAKPACGARSLENFYEEIATTQQQLAMQLLADCGTSTAAATVASHSVGSLAQTLVQEEQRRVQSRHHKTLGELNLSVEAMLMPDSPSASSERAAVAFLLCAPQSDAANWSNCTDITHNVSRQLQITPAYTLRNAKEPNTDWTETAMPSVTKVFHASTIRHYVDGQQFSSVGKASSPPPTTLHATKARSFWTSRRWRRKLSSFTATSKANDGIVSLADERELNLTALPVIATAAKILHAKGHNNKKHNRNRSERTAPHTRRTNVRQQHQHNPNDIDSNALASDSRTIAGESVSASGSAGGSAAAVGVNASALNDETETAGNANSSGVVGRTVNVQKPRQAAMSGNALAELEQRLNALENCSAAAWSATNQRNSHLRSTFNRARQHLSFDKWRLHAASPPHNASGNNNNNGIGGKSPSTDSVEAATRAVRRASEYSITTRDDDLGTTPPGESTAGGGRLSRWFSIRRGSAQQYDVGGGGRHSVNASTSLDLPDTAAALGISLTAAALDGCGSGHKAHSTSLKQKPVGAHKMPDVPECDDDDALSASATRLVLDDLVMPTEGRSRANVAELRLNTPMLPPAPAGLSQQQLKRRHIVAAIVHSENSYVATLQRLVYDYKQPLEASSPPVLSGAKIATLFHSLPEILLAHQKFRIVLADCVRHWDRDEQLGDCFVSAFSAPSILDIYSAFINNFSIAMELAKMEEKRKSALADFFKVKQISAHDRLSFFGLMVKPVQRFPQFILFLQDLLKYTPHGHHDRMALQLALTQLELLAEMLNERKREAEQYQAFREMLAHISGTFSARALNSSGDGGSRRAPARSLLRADNVTQLEFNQAGVVIKAKQRRLLLLNDRVICVSVAPKQSHDFGANEKLTCKWMHAVPDVEIVENSTSATLSRLLTAGLQRGGSLKANCGAPAVSAAPVGEQEHSTTPGSAAADHLCSEMSTLMCDYEVISRVHDLLGGLRGAYPQLSVAVTRQLLNDIQAAIQRKDEEMAWLDSCCMQLIARHKSGREEAYTFQAQSEWVKREWLVELRLAQLALDANNSPAWELALVQSAATQGAMMTPPPPPLKMPLFVRALPVHKAPQQTELRCGCYYAIAAERGATQDAGATAAARRRRQRPQHYLWLCTSDGASTHVALLAHHAQRASQLRDASGFELLAQQVSAIEFVPGTAAAADDLHADLIWMGTSCRQLLIYAARQPERAQQLSSAVLPDAVQHILYHSDAVYVALTHARVLVYRRRSSDGDSDSVWPLHAPQTVQLGESQLAVRSLLAINQSVYAACANRVYVLSAHSGATVQRSFEVQHASQQSAGTAGTAVVVQLMAHSGIGLWLALRHSTLLCLYHTETFKHLQDINIASSILRDGSGVTGKRAQAVNNSAIYVTALMACRGLLWVGTNVGIALTVPLPRLEGVPIISGRISISRHAHFGPITLLLPLVPRSYTTTAATAASTAQPAPPTTGTAAPITPPPPPSMGENLQLPAIDADEAASEAAAADGDDDDKALVILRRDLRAKDDAPGREAVAPTACSTPRSNHGTTKPDQSLTAKVRASLVQSPALQRRRHHELLTLESSRHSKTLPRSLGATGASGGGNCSSASSSSGGGQSNASTLSHGASELGGGCDVYGLYGKLIFVKEDYDAQASGGISGGTGGGTQRDIIDTLYDGMRRSDPELAAIPGRVCTLDRRLRMKAARPRSLDLSNWSVESKSSSLCTSSGSEESMALRYFNNGGGGRSVSRNSSSASHTTSSTGGSGGVGATLKPSAEQEQVRLQRRPSVSLTTAALATAAGATLKRKQKQTAKQQQQRLATDGGPRTVVTVMGGRGYWRHVWYGSAPNKAATLGGGASSPLIANSNDAHVVIWEKKL